MSTKRRLSASVDAEALAVAEAAVARGETDSVSAWVNDALHLKAEHDRRLAVLAALIREYEAEHGVITEQEMQQASRRARAEAIVVRGSGER